MIAAQVLDELSGLDGNRLRRRLLSQRCLDSGFKGAADQDSGQLHHPHLGSASQSQDLKDTALRAYFEVRGEGC